MTMNRLITTLIQLSMLAVVTPLTIAMIKDFKQLMKEGK
jgi:hypothetical protein